jgi:hypothetical protein
VIDHHGSSSSWGQEPKAGNGQQEVVGEQGLGCAGEMHADCVQLSLSTLFGWLKLQQAMNDMPLAAADATHVPLTDYRRSSQS